MFARKLTDDELTKTSTIRGGKANSTSSMPYGRAELIEPGSEPHNTRTLGPITTQVFTGAEAAAALELSRTAPTESAIPGLHRKWATGPRRTAGEARNQTDTRAPTLQTLLTTRKPDG